MSLGRLLLMVSLLTLLLNGTGFLADSEQVLLEVNCPDPKGCFRLIERAVEEAPIGATLQISSGVYYEKSIIVEKSLALERLGGRGTVEIRFVDPQPGLTIRLADNQRPTKVIVRGLTLITQALSRAADERDDLPIAVLIGGDMASIESLKVAIEASAIYGYAGIGVHGAHLILRQSTINVDAWSVNASFSKLELFDNSLTSAGLHQGFNVGLTNTEEAVLQNNRIWMFRPSAAVFQWAVFVGGTSELGQAHAVLFGNEIRGADVGAVVAGKAAVEFSRKRFVDNKDYGIMLLLPPCATREERGLFEGQIQGAENQFEGNGQDLCPEDYPWPEGFKKP